MTNSRERFQLYLDRELAPLIKESVQRTTLDLEDVLEELTPKRIAGLTENEARGIAFMVNSAFNEEFILLGTEKLTDAMLMQTAHRYFVEKAYTTDACSDEVKETIFRKGNGQVKFTATRAPRSRPYNEAIHIALRHANFTLLELCDLYHGEVSKAYTTTDR